MSASALIVIGIFTLAVLCSSTEGAEHGDQELIMLEIQPIIYEKTLVKRSPIAQLGQEQYIQQPGSEVPPEYLNFLQQLQLQQGVIPQQSDQNLQQVLVSRTPQTFTGQPPRPPPRRLTPEQEQQRRLQENIAQKAIREQEVRDAQRQQQAQLQKLFGQGVAQVDPLYLAQIQQAAQLQQLQQQQQQYVQVPEARQFVSQLPQAQPQQYVQVSAAQQAAEPERVSYSQVQFGSNKLPRRLAKFLPQQVQSAYAQQPQQEFVYSSQPQQAAAYVQSKVQQQPQQQLVYSSPAQPSAQELILAAQQNQIYEQQQQQQQQQQHQQQARRTVAAAAEVKANLPQQYLIETTKIEPSAQAPQQLVTIPKPKLQQIYYRPQASYQDLQASLLAAAQQQQQAQFVHQQQPTLAEVTTTAPSRSSIYVTTSRSPELKVAYHQKSAGGSLSDIRLQKPIDGQQRPLSQTELNALINVGFKVSPSSSSLGGQEYTTYQPQFSYYNSRELGKRQNRPVPRPVQLTTDERRALAKEGIRNLYRVESAESNNTPVTYVLALSSPGKQ